MKMDKRTIDLRGQKFGRLTVDKYLGSRNRRVIYWECLCSCGNRTETTTALLRSGKTKSCGCLQREWARRSEPKVTHGLTGTRLFNIWNSMKQRCENPKNPSYKNYGGRGIKIGAAWQQFERFVEDMGAPPPGTTLDRIDNNKGYTKSNCRWATRITQNRNRRDNVVLTFNGKTKTVSEWAETLGISVRTVKSRVHILGWTYRKALFTPSAGRLGTKVSDYRGQTAPQ